MFVALDCLGVWVLVKLERRYYSMDDIDARLEVIRQQGLPTNEEELQSWYPDAPDEENAALVFEKAFDAYHESEEVTEFFKDPASISGPLRTAELSQQGRQILSRYVADNTECLRLVRQALEKPRCHFPLEFHIGSVYEKRYHVFEFRNLRWLLQYKTALEIPGDPVAAWDTLLTEARLSQVLAGEPFDMAPLFRGSLENSVRVILESILTRTESKDSELVALSQILSRDDLQAAEFRIAAADRCLGIILFYDFLFRPVSISDLIRREDRVYPSEVPILSQLAQKQCLAAYLDFMEPVVELSKLPRYLRDGRMDELGARVKDSAAGTLANPTFDELARNVVSSTIETALHRINSMDRCCANRTLMLAGIAIERYRIANGRLPETLDALVPQFLNAVPLDIYDGRPLRYLKRDKGYVVYSVYENERDDGGAEIHDSKESKEKGDLTFIVER